MRRVSIGILRFAACLLVGAPALADGPTGNAANERLDQRGERIEGRLDRRGDRIDRRRGGSAD
jgi:hypothetical protein